MESTLSFILSLTAGVRMTDFKPRGQRTTSTAHTDNSLSSSSSTVNKQCHGG